MSHGGAEDEASVMAAIQRALADQHPDGKHRRRLKQVTEDRIANVRKITGFQTLEALRAGDRKTYERFLAGCRRAMIRDGLIESGHVGENEIRALVERHETRDLHAAFDDESDPADREGALP
jgi:hypothetical protein